MPSRTAPPSAALGRDRACGLVLVAQLVEEALELAPRGLEGVAHRDVRILVSLVITRIVAHHDLLARAAYVQLDTDVEGAALLVMAMGKLDGDIAAMDVGEGLELVRQLDDSSFEGWAGLQVLEGHVGGKRHVQSFCTCRAMRQLEATRKTDEECRSARRASKASRGLDTVGRA